MKRAISAAAVALGLLFLMPVTAFAVDAPVPYPSLVTGSVGYDVDAVAQAIYSTGQPADGFGVVFVQISPDYEFYPSAPYPTSGAAVTQSSCGVGEVWEWVVWGLTSADIDGLCVPVAQFAPHFLDALTAARAAIGAMTLGPAHNTVDLSMTDWQGGNYAVVNAFSYEGTSYCSAGTLRLSISSVSFGCIDAGTLALTPVYAGIADLSWTGGAVSSPSPSVLPAAGAVEGAVASVVSTVKGAAVGALPAGALLAAFSGSWFLFRRFM